MLCGAARSRPHPAEPTTTGSTAAQTPMHANCALWRIVITRLATDPRTRGYRDRRTKQRLSNAEIIRCLKRYVAREIYTLLTARTDLPSTA
jgi:transposase